MMKYILKFAGWYIGNKSKYNSYKNFKIHYTEDLFPLVGITNIVITAICWVFMLCLLSYMNINILVLVYQLKPE